MMYKILQTQEECTLVLIFWWQGYQIWELELSSTSLLTNTMTELQKNRAKISIAKIALRWPILECICTKAKTNSAQKWLPFFCCSFNHWLFSNLLQIKVSWNEILFLAWGLTLEFKWLQSSKLVNCIPVIFNCRKC